MSVPRRSKFGVLAELPVGKTAYDLTRVVATELVQVGPNNVLNPAAWCPIYCKLSEVTP